MQDTQGAWQGIAVDLWRYVAAELGLQFESASWRSRGRAGLQRRVIAVATATASADREPLIEFSHPYYRANSDRRPKQPRRRPVARLLGELVSVGLLEIAGALIGLIVLAGVLVWLIERRTNPEQFSASPRRGLGDGLWWAAVTMATVGYGDKAPRTGLGRALGVVEMFAAIVLIALLTAQVTSSLTVSSLSGVVRGPADLVRVRVGAIDSLSPRRCFARNSVWPRAVIPASMTACARSNAASWMPSSESSR